MARNPEENIKNSKCLAKQSNQWCWRLENLEATISFGSKLLTQYPAIKILLLEGPLGAGKTSLVAGIAKSLGIDEAISSPTFALAQHYPQGKPPLVHLDLYRLEDPKSANELFLQEEEEVEAMEALMIVEWAERLSLPIPEAWRGKMNYAANTNERIIELKPPSIS